MTLAFSSNLSKTFGTLEGEESHSSICALDRFSLCWDTSQLCTKSLSVNTAIKCLFLEPFLSLRYKQGTEVGFFYYICQLQASLRGGGVKWAVETACPFLLQD